MHHESNARLEGHDLRQASAVFLSRSELVWRGEIQTIKRLNEDPLGGF